MRLIVGTGVVAIELWPWFRHGRLLIVDCVSFCEGCTVHCVVTVLYWYVHTKDTVCTVCQMDTGVHFISALASYIVYVCMLSCMRTS